MTFIKEIQKIINSLFQCCTTQSEDEYINDNYKNKNEQNNQTTSDNQKLENLGSKEIPSNYNNNNVWQIKKNKKKSNDNKQTQKLSYSQIAKKDKTEKKIDKKTEKKNEKKQPKRTKSQIRNEELQHPSSTELNNLSKALQKILRIDENRFINGKDIRINPQQSIRVGQQGDNASGNLFIYVDMKKFNSIPTYKAFYNLLDNYNPELGVSESTDMKEEKEKKDFIDALCNTTVIKYTFNYLVESSRIPNDISNFKHELYKIWFQGYNRRARNDTSAFEHVFVGEIKENNEGVIGFHNWITIYNEEKKGNFNYRGWIPPRRNAINQDRPTQDSFALSIKFDWKGIEKPVSSCLIGTSPECEIALYTLLYYFKNKEEITFEDYTISFTMHTFEGRFGRTIGSCYPELI